MEPTEAAQSAAIRGIVGKVTDSLKGLEKALHKRLDEEILHASDAVQVNSTELQQTVSAMANQRVLLVSSEHLMEAGVVLYNASRATQKALLACQDQVSVKRFATAQFPLLFTRFMGTRVMGLALSCSKDDRNQAQTGDSDERSVFVQDCLDVLRSFGRVGAQFINATGSEPTKSLEYLHLAKEALDGASTIWNRIGLACLTKFAEGVELEEVLQDLWEFCVDRIRVARLLGANVTNADEQVSNDVVETLHELQMLLPYMCDRAVPLLELIDAVLQEWAAQNRTNEVISVAEETLRLCDSLENNEEDKGTRQAASLFKRKALVVLLKGVGESGDIQKAEACFALLGSEKDSSVTCFMLNLYIKYSQLDRAAVAVKQLLECDDLQASLCGTRLFVKATGFSDESIQLYKRLERHHGEDALQIRVDFVRCLADSHQLHHREHALKEMAQLKDQVSCISDQTQETHKFRASMQRVLDEVAKEAFGKGEIKESISWAMLGVEVSPKPHESAHFKRFIAQAHRKLEDIAESKKWSEDAYQTDSSKESLLEVFATILADSSASLESSTAIVRTLQSRFDYHVQDLVAYGHAAHIAERSDVCLNIMEDLCSVLSKNQDFLPSLPFDVLLQNTAQLALRRIDDTDSRSRLSTMLKYAELFLEWIDSPSKEKEGEYHVRKSIFEWFYSMSFLIAMSAESARLFNRAADIAQRAVSSLQVEDTSSFTEIDCLLAAVATAIASDAADVDSDHIRTLIGCIDKISHQGLHSDFIAKCEVFTRLKSYDPDVHGIQQVCQNKLPRSVESFIEVAELALITSRTGDAEQVRVKYRKLAHDLFKYGLQLALQADEAAPEKISYLFRRLINLSDNHLDAYQWFDQLMQLAGSIDLNMNEIEAEWFIATSWNIGIREHRMQHFKQSSQFMTMALGLIAKLGRSTSTLGKELHEQFQQVMLTAEDPSTL